MKTDFKMNEKQKRILRWGLVVLSAALIVIGAMQGEIVAVYNKAANICLECIGLG